MIKYHINNELTKVVKACGRFNTLSEEEHIKLYEEIRNATMQKINSKLVNLRNGNIKQDNKHNSLLLWVLEITDNKPVKYNTVSSKGGLPDADIDVEQANRDKIFNYFSERYGSNRVSQVSTLGKLAAKASIKAAQRCLQLPLDKANIICKYIPEIPDIKLKDAIESSSELKELLSSDIDNQKIWDLAIRFEGLPNNSSIHAAAIVVSDINLDENIPLMTVSRGKERVIATQSEYKDVEAQSFCKNDNLGLKTLDVIHKAVDLIKQYKNIDIDIYNIDPDDKNIYTLLHNGNNTLIFQCESYLFSDFGAKFLPNSIKDMSVMTSILRPGCLATGLHNAAIDAKFNNNLFTYNLKDEKLIKNIQDICSDSYSILVYQESIMKIFKEIGGFNDIQANEVRAAISKKKDDELKKYFPLFIENGIKLGFLENDLKELLEQIQYFSGYGFALCLDGHTLIKDSNDNPLSIIDIEKKLKNNQEVYLQSLNTDTQEIFNDKCLSVINNGKKEIFEIILDNGNIINCTLDHKFLCEDMIMRSIKDILDHNHSIVYI